MSGSSKTAKEPEKYRLEQYFVKENFNKIMNITKNFLKPKDEIFSFFIFTVVFLLALALSPSSKAQNNLSDNSNFDLYGPGVDIIIVAPPGIFTLPESQTNITRVCTLGEALNIVLDVSGKNKIEFQDPIVDMCDNETIENLDQHFQMDKVGKVTVDSDSLPYLEDKSALITMRNLPFEEEPDIEVDGKPATDQDIKNKSWDQSSKTLTFKAEHFTTYKAVANPSMPSATTEAKQIEEGQQSISKIGNIFLMLIIIAIVVVVIGIAGYLVWRKKQSL